MGNAFSGIQQKVADLDGDIHLTPEQRDYLHKLKEYQQNNTIHGINQLLTKKVPNYFYQPDPRPPVVLGYRPGKGPPNSRLSNFGAPTAPPAPSFIHYHPRADMLRRHLFLHIFSEQFEKANVPMSKLFVTDPNGESDGELKIAHIHVINGIHRRKPATPSMLSLDELSELQQLLPTLAKIRIMIKTSRKISKSIEEHAVNNVPGPTLNQTHEYVHILEMRAEVTGFDMQNKVVRPPGVVGVGARLFVEQEKEMGRLVERKSWEWCVEQVRELCKAVIGEDGGVWEFLRGGWEDMAVDIEGEGLINCFVVKGDKD